jgi:hypothetical protein
MESKDMETIGNNNKGKGRGNGISITADQLGPPT